MKLLPRRVETIQLQGASVPGSIPGEEGVIGVPHTKEAHLFH